MKINIGATRKALTAGCFALALVFRVEANDFSEWPWHNAPLVFSNQVYLLPTSGTLGEGLEARYSISDSLKLRLRQASQDMSEVGTRRSVNYNLTFKMFSNSAIFDWHVFGGDFRTSVGMIFGQTELSGSAYYYTNTVTANGQTITGSEVISAAGKLNPAQSYTAGQWTVTGAQIQQYVSTIDPAWTASSRTTTITGRDLLQASVVARYPGHAPYLGFGWGNYQFRKSGFLYTIDVGVMYLGRPKVDLSVSGPMADYAQQYYPVEFQSYLAGEQHKIEETMNKYRYYPVLTVGVWYRF
jgi:hypothetical protein